MKQVDLYFLETKEEKVVETFSQRVAHCTDFFRVDSYIRTTSTVPYIIVYEVE